MIIKKCVVLKPQRDSQAGKVSFERTFSDFEEVLIII
jgi:hypothetical protein